MDNVIYYLVYTKEFTQLEEYTLFSDRYNEIDCRFRWVQGYFAVLDTYPAK